MLFRSTIVSSNSKREIINRAKDLMMKVKGMSESEAYSHINEEAKRQNCTVDEYARIIVEKRR